MQVKLRNRWIMVKDLPLREEKSGLVVDLGLHYGEKARKTELWRAEVIEVSPKFEEMIPKGSTVLYDAYSGGYNVDIDGVEHFVTKVENVQAVLCD